MLLNILILLAGAAILYGGSELLIRGAVLLAVSASIRPVVVGLTVVAFATSAPELLVSAIAAWEGSSGISLGNILGSNVANIALVLGLSAMINPLSIGRHLIYREIPFMIAVSGLFCLIHQLIGRI